MPIYTGLDALAVLSHRAGYVGGEGDGCGILIDIPRELWAQRLEAAELDGAMARHPRFAVAHLIVSRTGAHSGETVEELVATACEAVEAQPLLVQEGTVHPHILGPMGRRENPRFIQVGLLLDRTHIPQFKHALEAQAQVHVASLSHDTVVYKVVGDAQTLWNYYSDLQHPRCETAFSLVHTRYSTNTQTSFARVQPFSVLGHNGEINTIARFKSEAALIGIHLDSRMSDSQMVNEVVETLVHERGWSLFEVAELLFPPIVTEQQRMQKRDAQVYDALRAMWGPFSQGPAGMMMRVGQEAVMSVDALGLRPLWIVETEEMLVVSSEQGIVPSRLWVADPRPLAPGEKFGVVWTENGLVRRNYHEFREDVVRRVRQRFGTIEREAELPLEPSHGRDVYRHKHVHAQVRAAAFGWREDDWRLLQEQVRTGSEPIRSLGYDGPLAALRPDASLIADYIQETVAVVTNPAIDREREVEHFSTRIVLGARPSFCAPGRGRLRLSIPSPLLFDVLPDEVDDVDSDTVHMLARRCGTLCLDDALAALHDAPSATVELLLYRLPGESVLASLERFQMAATQAVGRGARAIVLDDRLQFRQGAHVDPLLVTAAVHSALSRLTSGEFKESRRRDTSLVLRTHAVRNLHDVMVAIGLGADAIVPILMWELAAEQGGVQGLENIYRALGKGIEKVISTLGIHELRGYERLFSAIGVHQEITDFLQIPHALDGPTSGLRFAQLEAAATVWQQDFDENDPKVLGRRKDFRLYPRIWRLAGQVAEQSMSYADFDGKLSEFESNSPINLRHLLSLQVGERQVGFADTSVDTSVDGHQYPLLISSMSFGSQGEVAYRAYAEAAHRLNIVAMNGEGGELKELLTAYPRHRGRQIASGRFGVNADLCNHAYVLEIKIGQGAKPGEGGHLPGSKVTELVASARNAAPGTDLISPSNHHDIYSIEDLAQVIFELRTVNPFAKIAVKVPIVPNIGTIAVGIAKAGADIVALSGFDGGTGAARAHALQRVGLPIEIGIRLVHQSLCDAGLRESVEIWADGGMKSATDVMKAILLGANRVGFGTMAMVALGCTACRACHKDTCHVGIATQITSVEEAAEKGLPKFEPRQLTSAVENLVNFFDAVGTEVAQLTRQFGARRTQDLVGRVDLLKQVGGFQQLDLGALLFSEARHVGQGTIIRYRTAAELYAAAAESTLKSTVFDVSAGRARADADSMQGSHAVGESHDVFENTGLCGYMTDGTEEPTSGVLTAVQWPWGNRYSSLIRRPQRGLGTFESGRRTRESCAGDASTETAEGAVQVSGVAGNGFAAYQRSGTNVTAHGGAQDGVAKGAFGGRTVVLKAAGAGGSYFGGSVGKGVAYGAQHGLVIVQGSADARAGVRLSGADLVIAGEPSQPVDSAGPFLAVAANIKGFAFEYMTAGRALVLGDPGPWICSGMTGGRVYLRHNPPLGLTEGALRKRIAKGAKVALTVLDSQGELDVADLLFALHRELRKSGQTEAAKRLSPLLHHPAEHFWMVQPGAEQTDQDVATE